MHEKPKRRPLPEEDCLICGQADYQWGRPSSQGGVYFLPEGAIYGFGLGEGLIARKCLTCGNVQLFIKGMYGSL